MSNQVMMELAIKHEKTEVCQHCGNIYRIELLKAGDNYNDFGFRHCPFCGLMTDEYAHGRYIGLTETRGLTDIDISCNACGNSYDVSVQKEGQAFTDFDIVCCLFCGQQIKLY